MSAADDNDRPHADPSGEDLMCELCRRRFIRGAAALGAAGATGLLSSPLMAQPRRGDAASSKLPARGEFTIANAYVITMDGALGDIAGGAVHVRNGEIVAIGKDVKGGGQKIDGTGMIVMPGLIETHWHMWNTLYRSFSGDKPEEGYFPTVARFGQQMNADDIFQSTRLSAAEAINSGMTFVHSWCHNVRSAAHAEADVRALAEVGIRARQSCGWPQGLPDTQSAAQGPIESLAKDWKSWSSEGLITLGMAWRGQCRAGPIKPEVYQPEFDNAYGARRELPQGRESDRVALQSEADGQGRAAHSHVVGKPRGARHDQGVGRCGLGVARLGTAYWLRLSADQRDASQGHSPRYLGRHLGAGRKLESVRRAQACARLRECQGRERVQDAGAQGARARHYRGCALDGDGRQDRLAQAR